jgi:hypothetical protein
MLLKNSSDPKRGKIAPKFLISKSELNFLPNSHTYYSEARKKKLTGRVVVWFSCGATSAVAAKLAVGKYENVHVVYCDTGGEHKSNKIFLQEVRDWLGQDIEVLKNKKYKDHFDVFRKTRFLVSRNTAKCSHELKRSLRLKYQDVDGDIQVFGFGVDELTRAEEFRSRNLDMYVECTLIDHGLDKGDRLAILKRSGFTLPFMYQEQRSGSPYKTNNCIGCVKGGAWYWNKIRIDFPSAFHKMAKIEQEIGRTCLRRKNKPLSLYDLPLGLGNPSDEPNMECGVLCEAAFDEVVNLGRFP